MIPISKNQIETTKPLGVLVDGRILLWSSVFDNEETRLYNFSFRHRREVVLFYDPSTKAFTDFVEMAEGFDQIYIGLLHWEPPIFNTNNCRKKSKSIYLSC